jgi:hypothetical protein
VQNTHLRQQSLSCVKEILIDAWSSCCSAARGHVAKQPRESKAVARCIGFKGARPTMDSASSKETWRKPFRHGFGAWIFFGAAVCAGNCMEF